MSITMTKGYAVPREGAGQYNGLGRMAFRAFYGDETPAAPSEGDNYSPLYSPSIELGDEPLKRWSAFYGYNGVAYGPSSPQYGTMRMTGGDVRGYGAADEAPSRATWFLLGLVAGGLLWPKLSARF